MMREEEEEKKCVDLDLLEDGSSVSSAIENLESTIKDLEARNRTLEGYNNILQQENEELHKKLAEYENRSHPFIVELQTTVNELQQRFMDLMEEKLNLLTSMEALEHKFMDVELNSDTDSMKNGRRGNSKKKAAATPNTTPTKSNDGKQRTSWFSPRSKDKKTKNVDEALLQQEALPQLSSAPAPAPADDASQAEILKFTIAQKRKSESSGWQGLLKFTTSPDEMDLNLSDNCKKEFEQFKRLSTLSDVRTSIHDDTAAIPEENLLDEHHYFDDGENSVDSDVCFEDCGMMLDHPHEETTTRRGRKHNDRTKRPSTWGRLSSMIGGKNGEETEDDANYYNDHHLHQDVIDTQRLGIHGGGTAATRSSRPEGTRLSVHAQALLE